MSQELLAKELQEAYPVDVRLFRELATWETLMPVHLLRAALLPEAEALQAYMAYTGSIDFDDPIQRQLLPQLHANIGHLLPAEMAVKLKQLRISTLMANRLLRTEMETVAKNFGNKGLPLLVFKGAAMTTLSYADAGCRPMSDLDLLVKEAHFNRACSLLEEAGWKVKNFGVDQPVFQMQIHHARACFHPQQKVHLDLHVHINHRACGVGVDEEYWSRAKELSLGSALLRLCNTDNLLQVCVHGTGQNDTPPIRWAMDAYLTMTRPQEGIDWDLLLAIAQRRFFSPELLLTLTWLQKNLQAPVPDRVLSELTGHSVCKHNLNIWRYSLRTNRRALRAPEIVHYHWHKLWLASRGLTWMGKLKFIPKYLKDSQHTNSYKVFALVVAKKLRHKWYLK